MAALHFQNVEELSASTNNLIEQSILIAKLIRLFYKHKN
jgi:hypothetical protein